MISPDTFFSGQSAQLAALASRYAVPTISPYREFVTAGGLITLAWVASLIHVRFLCRERFAWSVAVAIGGKVDMAFCTAYVGF